MRTRSKALLVVALLVVVVLGSVGAMLLGARFAARHIPARSVLSLELAGTLPERAPDEPFAELFIPHETSQQEVRDALVRAARDPRIRAVRVKVGPLATSFATVQEIRALLRAVSAAGKPTAAYLETAGEFAPGNLDYYLACACDKVVLSPLGDVNLIGVSARVPFIRGMLDKLGIEPDFPGIGKYKTARFFYTERELTPEAREMTEWLVGSLSDQLVEGVSESRRIPAERTRAIMAEGPKLGQEAVRTGLVDELADWPTFCDETTRSDAGELDAVSLSRYLRAGSAFAKGAPLAVVVAEGTILRGASGYSPLPVFGGDVMGSDTISRAFREVRDSNARAVIFRINSPGGSAVASEVIRAEMVKTAKSIPVVVSMGGVAASGGYWITCGAQRVVADPATITASIGVFGGHFAMDRFWADKLGVTWGRVDGGPNADLYGSLDPWTPGQREQVQRFLDRIYDSFLERVSAARHLSREQVDALGRGRVFTGRQALERKLVDRLGGFVEAVDAARELASIASDAGVELEYYPRRRSVLERLLETEASRADPVVAWWQALARPGSTIGGPVWLPPIEIR